MGCLATHQPVDNYLGSGRLIRHVQTKRVWGLSLVTERGGGIRPHLLHNFSTIMRQTENPSIVGIRRAHCAVWGG